MKNLRIKLHYNDKDIEVNGTNYIRKEDENGPRVEGEIAMHWIEEIVDLEEYRGWEEKAKSLGFTNENYYEVGCDGRYFFIPLKPPEKIDEDEKEEMYNYGKNKYFDLYLLGEHILAEKEIPQKIKEMEKGTTFTFEQFFKEYTIVDDQEQFEIYSKVLGQVIGLIKVDEEELNKKKVQAFEHNLENYDLPQQVKYSKNAK